MTSEQRMSVFVRLGELFKSLSEQQDWGGYSTGLTEEEYGNWLEIVERAKHHNGWFTPDQVRLAMKAWAHSLDPGSVRKWFADLQSTTKAQTVAIIMAGNIPMVGLHDLLCVYATANRALIKPSSDDVLIMNAVVDQIRKWDVEANEQLEIADGKLENFDAVIATGSNNTSRYFEQYFGKYPHIIRKSRTSVAVLSGDESKEELHLLGHDIFDYYGMGCRSVTKIYFPKDYDVDLFFKGIFDHGEVVNQNKYGNNYDYHKALWLLNGEPLLDNSFVLLKEDKSLSSPLGSLFYEYYEDGKTLMSELNNREREIQCLVGQGGLKFGESQSPELWDYADNVNTIEWLKGLSAKI